MDGRNKLELPHTIDYPAVDQYASSHLNSQAVTLNKALAQSSATCQANGFPDWASISSQGKFLMLQCRLLGVQHVLELGTLGGHGTIWCSAASPNIKITTIEMDKKYAVVARENLQAAGISNRTELIVDRAQNVLPRLLSEIDRGERERFGMIVVDITDFTNTWELLDKAISLCVGRACIIAHCAVRLSNLALTTETERGDLAKGSRRLVENVGKDERIDAALLMCVGEQRYDVLMAVVRDDIEAYLKTS